MSEFDQVATRVSALQEQVDQLFKEFDPNQPRDDHGRWSEGGGLAHRPSGGVATRARGAKFKDLEGAYKSAYPEGFTKPVKHAVQHYMGGVYGPLNRHLRGGPLGVKFYVDQSAGTEVTSEYIMNVVKSIDSTFAPVDKDLVVWRGVGTNAERFKKLLSAKSFSDPGYVSTSVGSKIALRFTDPSSLPGRTPLLLKIIVPKGAKVSLPAAITGTDYDAPEQEVLLPRGTRFVPVSYTVKRNRWQWGSKTVPIKVHVLTVRAKGPASPPKIPTELKYTTPKPRPTLPPPSAKPKPDAYTTPGLSLWKPPPGWKPSGLKKAEPPKPAPKEPDRFNEDEFEIEEGDEMLPEVDDDGYPDDLDDDEELAKYDTQSEELATRVSVIQERVDQLLVKYSPDQPRDDHGRWSEGGGGSSTIPVFHGTQLRAFSRILRDGIKSGLSVYSKGPQQGVHARGSAATFVTTNLDEAQSYARQFTREAGKNRGIILRIDLPRELVREQLADSAALAAQLKMPPVSALALDRVKPEWIKAVSVATSPSNFHPIRPATLRKAAANTVTAYVVVQLPEEDDELVKYDPKQPRDEDGKWSETGGGATSELDTSWKRWVLGNKSKNRAAIRSAAKMGARYGVDPATVHLRYTDAPVHRFDTKSGKLVAGKTDRNVLGRFDPNTGKLYLWPLRSSPKVYDMVLAHEMTHARFNEYRKTAKGASGWITSNLSKLRAEGGVSPYSKAVWKQVDPILAVNETLAEMSRVQEQTGNLPGGPTFQELYRQVMEHKSVKKYDPNQPRDEDGKWSETGAGGDSKSSDGKSKQWSAWKKAAITAGATAAGAAAVGLAGYAAHRNLVNHVGTMGNKYGIHPGNVKIRYDLPSLSGRKPFGLYHFRDNNIEIYPMQRLGSFLGLNNHLKGTVAHEMTHSRFDRYFNSPKGKAWYEDNFPELAYEGGVTPYSNGFWKAAQDATNVLIRTRAIYPEAARPHEMAVKRKVFNAVHETLAEMSAVKEQTGKLPGGPAFKDLYRQTMEYQGIPGKGFYMRDKRAMVADIEKLTERVTAASARVATLLKTYDPNQPRAGDGKWTDTGGTSLGRLAGQRPWSGVGASGRFTVNQATASQSRSASLVAQIAEQNRLQRVQGAVRILQEAERTGAKYKPGSWQSKYMDLVRATVEDFKQDLKPGGKYAHLVKYAPDQPRDDHGRWSETGAGKQGKTIAFHGTVGSQAATIKQHGIKLARGKRKGLGALFKTPKGESIFQTASPSDAQARAAFRARKAKDKPIVVELNVPTKQFNKFKRDITTSAAFFTTSVSPKWVVGIKKLKQVKPFEYTLVDYDEPDEPPKGKTPKKPKKVTKQESMSEGMHRMFLVLGLDGDDLGPDEEDDVQKEFDPNQPRDDSGKWSETGAGGGKTGSLSGVMAHGKKLTQEHLDWVKSRVETAASTVIKSPKTKSVVAAAINAMLDQASGSASNPINDKLVETYIENISTNAKVSYGQASTALRGALNALKKLRGGIKKADAMGKPHDMDMSHDMPDDDDELLAIIDKVLECLDRCDAKKAEALKEMAKLEDRVLVAQDKVDVIRQQTKG